MKTMAYCTKDSIHDASAAASVPSIHRPQWSVRNIKTLSAIVEDTTELFANDHHHSISSFSRNFMYTPIYIEYCYHFECFYFSTLWSFRSEESSKCISSSLHVHHIVIIVKGFSPSPPSPTCIECRHCRTCAAYYIDLRRCSDKDLALTHCEKEKS